MTPQQQLGTHGLEMMTAAHQKQEILMTGAWSVHDLLSRLSVAGGSLMGGTNNVIDGYGGLGAVCFNHQWWGLWMVSGTVSVLDGLWHVEFEGSEDSLQGVYGRYGFQVGAHAVFIFWGGVLVMGEGWCCFVWCWWGVWQAVGGVCDEVAQLWRMRMVH